MSDVLQQVMEFDDHKLADLYRKSGLGEQAVAAQSRQLRLCLDNLKELDLKPASTPRAFFVPGRIEILGKHTDYAGGRSMVCAVDRGFCFLVSERSDRIVRIIDAKNRSSVEINLDSPAMSSSVSWQNYPLTVVRRLALNFGKEMKGADIFFSSDLPPASGMSSSSALMIGIFLCLSSVSQLSKDEEYRRNIESLESLAMYLACIENGQSFGSLAGESGVGTFGGSEDHIAILCGRPDSFVQYRYAPIVHERTIQSPPDYVFVVAYSGVKANKIETETREKYNRKSLLARHLADLWRQSTGGNEQHLYAILKSSNEALGQLIEIVNHTDTSGYPRAELIARLEHFVAESEEIVVQAGDALEEGDLARFQAIVDRSQELTERLLDNQVPETVYLAHSARHLGAQAASCFGAGFGGSVWALVSNDSAGQFMTDWANTYHEKFPQAAQRSTFLTCHTGPAATEITLQD